MKRDKMAQGGGGGGDGGVRMFVREYKFRVALWTEPATAPRDFCILYYVVDIPQL